MARITLIQDNLWTYVRDAPINVLDGLREFLKQRVMDEKKLAIVRRKHGARKRGLLHWDGCERLFDWRARRFPAGLTKSVIEWLNDKGVDCVFEDMTPWPISDHASAIQKAVPAQSSGISLRDYQKSAIENAIAMRRAVICMPGGSGKTVTAACIVHGLLAQIADETGETPKALWLTHENSLLQQSAEAIERTTGLRTRTFSTSALVGRGFDLDHDVSVVNISTAYRAVRKDCRSPIEGDPPHYQIVVADECHRCEGKIWKAVLSACRAPYRFGLSATPFGRADRLYMNIIGLLGPPLVVEDAESLIQKNYLAKPIVTFWPVNEEPKSDRVGGYDKHDLYSDYRRLICWHWHRNGIAAALAFRHAFVHGHSTIIFVRYIQHGRMFSKVLSCPFVHGRMSRRARKSVWDALREGDERLVVCTDQVASEGVDIPNLDAIIVASAMKADIPTAQRAFRGMRPKGSDNVFYVHDFLDNHWKHARYSWTRQRRKCYMSFGAEVRNASDEDVRQLLADSSCLKVYGAVMQIQKGWRGKHG